jgi:hypothetical protein
VLDQAGRKPEARLDDEERAEPLVCCRRCDAEVARTSDRVVIGPGDLHTFVNPRGEVFELVCFARADGAVAVGEATLEYTWFPGHAWRFAMCRSCAAQLGWRYEGVNRFWGLIRTALRFR